jgi:hypothetical protein
MRPKTSHPLVLLRNFKPASPKSKHDKPAARELFYRPAAYPPNLTHPWLIELFLTSGSQAVVR